jgi:hypothetical protein
MGYGRLWVWAVSLHNPYTKPYLSKPMKYMGLNRMSFIFCEDLPKPMNIMGLERYSTCVKII